MEYLIKSSALIIVFYLGYKFLLQRDTFFQTNRWYLLLGIAVSFCLPLVVIPVYITKQISAQFFTSGSTIVTETTAVAAPFNWIQLLGYIYILGIIFLSVRFISHLISLGIMLSRGSISKRDNFIFVETKDDVAPFSFFNYIVYNPSNFSANDLEHIINHEKIHANQHHSIDILISHLASIVCWFNPFIWMYKKELQQNLEFIADKEALLKSECRKDYQYVLLKTSVPNHQMALTNNFYNSLIKKRIVMLHKNRSKKRNQLKTLLILPLLALFLMSFSTKEIVSYETISEYSEKELKEVISPKTKNDKNVVTSTPSKALAANTTTIDVKPTFKKANKKGEVEIIVITKDMTDKELDNITARLKKDNITLKFKGIERNKNNEITSIQIVAKSKNSNATISETQDDAIDPITIKIEDGSISIGNGHDTGHRDYHFTSKDGKTKVHKSKSGSDVFVYSSSDTKHDKHEIIEDDDKIIIKSGSKIKEIKKGNGKNIWVTSGDAHGEHEVIEIDEDGDGESVIIKYQGKDGKVIKSKSKSEVWISNDEDDEERVFELKSGDGNIFISTDSDGKKPLFVVDGKEIGKGKMGDIDPNSIKSVNVLKGDAAMKKYGKKGKDGVVEITTKD